MSGSPRVCDGLRSAIPSEAPVSRLLAALLPPQNRQIVSELEHGKNAVTGCLGTEVHTRSSPAQRLVRPGPLPRPKEGPEVGEGTPQ